MDSFVAWTRRLLALPIGLGTAGTLIFLAVDGGELAKEAFVTLGVMGSFVIGFYFGQKD